MCWMYYTRFLLHHMPQFMRQMPFLPRTHINLRPLRIGQRLQLGRFIRIIMYPDIIKRKTAPLLKIQLHLRGNTRQIRLVHMILLRRLLLHFSFHIRYRLSRSCIAPPAALAEIYFPFPTPISMQL